MSLLQGDISEGVIMKNYPEALHETWEVKKCKSYDWMGIVLSSIFTVLLFTGWVSTFILAKKESSSLPKSKQQTHQLVKQPIIPNRDSVERQLDELLEASERAKSP